MIVFRGCVFHWGRNIHATKGRGPASSNFNPMTPLYAPRQLSLENTPASLSRTSHTSIQSSLSKAEICGGALVDLSGCLVSRGQLNASQDFDIASRRVLHDFRDLQRGGERRGVSGVLPTLSRVHQDNPRSISRDLISPGTLL